MSNNKARSLNDLLQDADKEQRQAITNALPYAVGYAKPPRQTRFSSSNQPRRRGRRRKQPQDPITVLEQELLALVEVVDGDKRHKAPKLHVGMRHLADKIATGNLNALKVTLELLSKYGRLGPSSAASLENQRLEAEDAKQQVTEQISRLLEAEKTRREMAKTNREWP